MATNDSDSPSNAGLRAWIGTILVIFSIVAIVVIAGIILNSAGRVSTVAEENADSILENGKSLMSMLLPMFGTWVGTILAFYFTKENFETANKATLDVIRSTSQILESKKVSAEMIHVGAIVALKIDAGKGLLDTKYSDISTAFASIRPGSSRKITRLPFFDAQMHCVAVLHSSVWMEICLGALSSGDFKPAPDTSLRELIKLAGGGNYEALVTTSIGFVALDTNLAAAKSEMDRTDQCQDVFVTASGKKGDPVLGWLTNIAIAAASRA